MTSRRRKKFFSWTDLWDDVEIRHQRRLQNNGNVRCVEEFDRVAAVLTAIAGWLDREIDAETLEVYYYRKDEDGGQEVHQVWKILTVEGLTKSTDLVLTGSEEMEECDDGALEFCSTSSVHCGWWEGFPHDCFANICGNEEGNSWAETVTCWVNCT